MWSTAIKLFVILLLRFFRLVYRYSTNNHPCGRAAQKAAWIQRNRRRRIHDTFWFTVHCVTTTSVHAHSSPARRAFLAMAIIVVDRSTMTRNNEACSAKTAAVATVCPSTKCCCWWCCVMRHSYAVSLLLARSVARFLARKLLIIVPYCAILSWWRHHFVTSLFDQRSQ